MDTYSKFDLSLPTSNYAPWALIIIQCSGTLLIRPPFGPAKYFGRINGSQDYITAQTFLMTTCQTSHSSVAYSIYNPQDNNYYLELEDISFPELAEHNSIKLAKTLE